METRKKIFPSGKECIYTLLRFADYIIIKKNGCKWARIEPSKEDGPNWCKVFKYIPGRYGEVGIFMPFSSVPVRFEDVTLNRIYLG